MGPLELLRVVLHQINPQNYYFDWLTQVKFGFVGLFDATPPLTIQFSDHPSCFVGFFSNPSFLFKILIFYPSKLEIKYPLLYLQV